MSELSNLLERAFENKGNKNRYSSGKWSIGFDVRVYDTRFELYCNNICVLEGNTLDKEFKITNDTVCPLDKFVFDVEKALPEYHFNIQIDLMIPVDFDGYWTQEVENAEYIETADECRYEDISDGYGYDIALFSIPHLSDLENVVITYDANAKYSIDDIEMRLGPQGELKVTPNTFVPLQKPLIEQIEFAENCKSAASCGTGKDHHDNER